MLTKNEGTIDRAARVLAGVSVLSLAFTGPPPPWGCLRSIPLVTGLAGTCPLYSCPESPTDPLQKSRWM